MDDLLFLAHRIPYPPNKGDKIRAWHILDHLTKTYRVHLGCFVDAPEDWDHTVFLEDRCASSCFVQLNPRLARLRSIGAFFTNEALSVAFYADHGMRNWVRETMKTVQPKAAFLYSSQMARFLPEIMPHHPRTVMDFVDVDSDKWAQYAQARSGPLRWLYAREAIRLWHFERQTARRVDASVFVSPHEADLFRYLISGGPDKKRTDKDLAERVHAVTNGVDCDRFAPGTGGDNPFPHGSRPIVFTGAMDYWPNADAVLWFAEEVFPQVKAVVPDAVFYIVGGKPGADVRAFEQQPGMTVTGHVPEVRDYLDHAAVVVAPLRVARGIQNKVLEGMAMGKPVVASIAAASGLDHVKPGEIAIAEEADAMAKAVIAALQGADGAPNGTAARQRVIDSYSWEGNLQVLDRLISG